MNRRMLMKGSAMLGAGLITNSLFANENGNGRIKHLVFINLKGGPSQFELFDAKPRSYNSGPTKAVRTKIKNVYFNKTLTGIVPYSDNMAVFRMSSPERDHKRGQYYLQTGGHRPRSSLKHPGLSSIVGWKKGVQAELPGAVAIGGFQGSGYLGAVHSPFGIENLEKTRELLEDIDTKRIKRTSKAQNAFHKESPFKNHQAMVDGDLISKRALKLSMNKKFREAIGETMQVNNYCPNMGPAVVSSAVEDEFSYNQDNSESFVASCGVAVEMVKIGVPAIQIELAGWDTHENNFETHTTLTTALNEGLRQIINGLKQNNLFDDTLIYVSGEFGRTPKISRNEGREDFSDIFCSALISGSIKKGRVFGETNFNGTEVKDAVSVSQLSGSIMKAMGIDPKSKVHQDQALVPIKREFLSFS